MNSTPPDPPASGGEEFIVVPLTDDLRPWANSVLKEYWCGPEIMSRWVWHDTGKLPGFVAIRFPPFVPPQDVGGESSWEGGNFVGLATYRIEGDECELITLNSLVENVGVGAMLLAAVRAVAVRAGCKRYWLTTSNDNLHAIRFYQKRGFRLVAIHVGAIDAARERKPGIPLIGHFGIECRDEVEMEENLKSER